MTEGLKFSAKKEKRKTLMFYAAFGLAFFALALLFPLSGDDWQWGSHGVIEIPALNGRYLGNLAVIVLTRFLWLRPVVIALTVTLIAYFTAAIPGLASPESRARLPRVQAALLYLLVPTAVMRQVFVWTSGFANFTLPVMLILAVIYLFAKNPNPKPIYMGLTCALAFACQFFAEHITLCAVTVSVLAAAYHRLRSKKANLFLVLLALSFIAGAALMFSSGAYSPEGTDGSHPMPGVRELLSNVSPNFFDVINPHGVFNNIFLNLFISAGVVILICAHESRSAAKGSGCKARYRAGLCIGAYMPLYVVYTLLRRFHPVLPFAGAVWRADGILSILFYLGFLLAVLLFIPDGKPKNLALLCLAAIFALCAPLLAVTPIGERCFFIVYALFAMAACVVWGRLIAQGALPVGRFPALLSRMSSATALACMFLLFFAIYGSVCLAGLRRQDYVERQVGAYPADYSGEIPVYMPLLPYENYVWCGTPGDPYNAYIYKKYYNLPDTVAFTVVAAGMYPEHGPPDPAGAD